MSEKFHNPKEIHPEKLAGFEEQFQLAKTLEFFGDTLSFIDAKPEHPKTLVPTLLAPGWGENQATYKETLKALYELGRHVISLDHPRRGENPESNDNTPAVELRKAKAILEILTEDGVSQIDAVAHSEGAINVAIAASLHPEKFRNIIFVAPGGLLGKDTFPKLFGRFSMELIANAGWGLLHEKDEGKRERLKHSGEIILSYISKNPIRALEEAMAISKMDITEMIKDLHGKGIGISIVASVDDAVFPMNQMQKSISKNMIDGFYSTKGDHQTLYANPEQYVPLIDSALDALEKKHR